jgi:uncharacterized membrane protein
MFQIQHDQRPVRSLRCARGAPRLSAVCLLAGGLGLSSAAAWSADLAGPPLAQTQAPAVKTSFAHSGLKTATYEIGNAIDNFVFLTAGAGGLAGGLLLTSFNTVQSWTVYTTNDFIWQKVYPPEAPKDGSDTFDMKQSAWRTTLKYMTGKPVVASIKIAALYVYTGSVATAFGFGLAATAGASVIFFANNLIWDYVDQPAAAGAPVPAGSQKLAVRLPEG